MALRKIICIEDELLRKKSRPVEKFDEKLHKLLDDMAETMYNANGAARPTPLASYMVSAISSSRIFRRRSNFSTGLQILRSLLSPIFTIFLSAIENLSLLSARYIMVAGFTST